MNRNAIVAGLIWVLSSSPIAAGVLLDQSHELTRYMSDAGVGFTIEQSVAQTVQMGIAGQLSGIQFWAAKTANSGLGNLILDIRPVDADGSPVEDASSILAQVVIPRDSIPTRGPSIPASVDAFLVSIDLAPFALFFEAGDSFAFNFTNSDSSGGQFGTAFGILGDLLHGSTTGPYAHGEAFLRNNQQANGEFFAWVGGVGDGPVDLGFRTFVTPAAVPEPGPLVTWLALGILTGSLARNVPPCAKRAKDRTRMRHRFQSHRP